MGSSHAESTIVGIENMMLQDIIPEDRETSNAEISPTMVSARASENGLPLENSLSAGAERQNEVHATSSDFQAFNKAVDTDEIPHIVGSPDGSVVIQQSPGDKEEEIGSDGYDREGVPKWLEEGTLWWPPKVGMDANELRRTARKEVQGWCSIDTSPSLNPEHCPFCRVYFDTWDTIVKSGFIIQRDPQELATPFHETMDHLKSAASQGCPLCNYILSIFRKGERKKELPGHHWDDFKFEPGTYLVLYNEVPEPDSPWWLRLQNSRNRMLLAELVPYDPSPLSFTTAENDSGESRTLPDVEQSGQAPFELQTGSLDLARHWLSDCLLDHEGCSQQDPAIIPTRLIKIDLENIRLCYSSEYKDCLKYVTLSHCWGKLDVLMLRKSNLSSLLQEIPYNSLCKTFRDAIEITRSLGLSWLWIDCLCIIQDDPNDWQKESVRMTTVYGMSTLNIAATAAPDGGTGCLFERDTIYAQGTRAMVEVDDKQRILEVVDPHFVLDNTTATPLSNRAWALQERLLAPRTLHFGISQLFWQCATKFACDRYRHQLPEYLAQFLISNIELHKTWRHIVFIYSKGLLTHQSDKLVAIAGIAEAIRNKTGDEYLAGLWRKDLETQLCWRVEDSPSSLELDLAGVPSWSWLSLRGDIFMHPSRYILLESYIKVVDVVITFEGSPTCDPFSLIDGGVLTISTQRILPCIVHRNPSCDGDSEYGRLHTEIHVAERAVDAIAFMDYNDQRDLNEICVLVPIGTFHDPDDIYGENKATHHGLILKRTQKNGQYKRIGAFFMEYDTIEPRYTLLQDLFKRAEAPAYMPIESDYQSIAVEDGKTWYTITII
jgi:hypothetical protein